MSFTLRRVPLEPRRRRLAVRSVEDLDVAPNYRRIVFEGADLAGFESLGADDHVRMFFPPVGEALSPDADAASLASREFTPAAFDADSVTFEFLLHGTRPASEWAAAAEPGDEVLIGGPRGSMVIDGEPDWWLLAGDLTALPAITRFLAAIPAGEPLRRVEVILLVEPGPHALHLAVAGDLRMRIVHDLDAFLAAIDEAPIDLLPGAGFAFVAAEQAVVAPVRASLARRGVDLDTAVVKGYWRRGLSADAPK